MLAGRYAEACAIWVGISVVRKDTFLVSLELINGVIAHTVLDQKSGFGVFLSFDFELAEKLSA